MSMNFPNSGYVSRILAKSASLVTRLTLSPRSLAVCNEFPAEEPLQPSGGIEEQRLHAISFVYHDRKRASYLAQENHALSKEWATNRFPCRAASDHKRFNGKSS